MEWSRSEKIAAVSLCIAIIACVAAIVVVPEVRQWAGWDGGNGTKKSHRIFNAAEPYPIGFEKMRLGMRLSVLKLLYPDGRFSDGWYIISIKEGVFNQVALWCGKSESESDLPVSLIIFYFRDQASETVAREEAFLAFGTDKVVSKDTGKTLEWPDMAGYNLSFQSQRYHIKNSKAF